MKKFYEFIKYDPDDDLEHEDEEDSLDWTIIGWVERDRDYTMFWDRDDWVYILQEETDYDQVVFYNNYNFCGLKDVYKNYVPLTDEELEEYIYSNKKRICVYDNQGGHDFVYYKDLPEDIKNKLR
jgi:hypothetical protein